MKTFPRITTEQVNEKLLELADKHPKAEYTSPRASYVKGEAGGGLGCIFGQALQELGVPREFLADFESPAALAGGWTSIPMTSIVSLTQRLNIKADPNWLIMQTRHDHGVSWERVVDSIRP